MEKPRTTDLAGRHERARPPFRRADDGHDQPQIDDIDALGVAAVPEGAFVLGVKGLNRLLERAVKPNS